MYIDAFSDRSDLDVQQRIRGGHLMGENMKYLFLAALAATAIGGFSAAEAAGGCGPGFHRNYYGGCRPNREVILVEPRVERPIVVMPHSRICGPGFSWRYGRCRPF